MTASSGIQLLHHANATNLNASVDGATVQTATVQTLTGVQFSAQASLFVVAVGGIQNPRLLLMSNDVVPQGLGNQHDQVGRYHTDHLAAAVAFIYLRPKVADLGLMTAVNNVATNSPSGAATAVNLMPMIDMSVAARGVVGAKVHFELIMCDMSAKAVQTTGGAGPDQIIELMTAQGGAPQSQALIRTFLKSEANPESRVTLGSLTDPFGRPRPRLNWAPTAADSTNRQAAMRYIANQFSTGGVGELHNTLDWAIPLHASASVPIPAWFEIRPAQILPQGDEPDPYHESCYHSMCSTRMSTVESDGVVDTNLRVHTTNNLYMAGPSVFRTGAGKFPTMPSVALAARLADHLNGVLP
jgi:choline dehydrogenase-like flavoprotein